MKTSDSARLPLLLETRPLGKDESNISDPVLGGEGDLGRCPKEARLPSLLAIGRSTKGKSGFAGSVPLCSLGDGGKGDSGAYLVLPTTSEKAFLPSNIARCGGKDEDESELSQPVPSRATGDRGEGSLGGYVSRAATTPEEAPPSLPAAGRRDGGPPGLQRASGETLPWARATVRDADGPDAPGETMPLLDADEDPGGSGTMMPNLLSRSALASRKCEYLLAATTSEDDPPPGPSRSIAFIDRNGVHLRSNSFGADVKVGDDGSTIMGMTMLDGTYRSPMITSDADLPLLLGEEVRPLGV